MLFQRAQQIYDGFFPRMFIIGQSQNTLQLEYSAELPPIFLANQSPFLQLQVIVKSYRQHTYLPKTLKHYRPEHHAKTTLSSQDLCCKHCISMYLDEYLIKTFQPFC